jgi:hypothetical protein
MLTIREQIDVVRVIAVVAAGMCGGACVTWQTQAIEPLNHVAFDSTKTYRVVLGSGEREVVAHPVVSGDSLVWLERLPEASFLPAKRRGIPLTEIRQVEALRRNAVATVLALWATASCVRALVLVSSYSH